MPTIPGVRPPQLKPGISGGLHWGLEHEPLVREARDMDHIHVLGEEIGLPLGELSVVQHGVGIEKLRVHLTNILRPVENLYIRIIAYITWNGLTNGATARFARLRFFATAQRALSNDNRLYRQQSSEAVPRLNGHRQ